MPPKMVPCPSCGDPMSRRSEICRKCYLEDVARYWEDQRHRALHACVRRRDVPQASIVIGLRPCEGCGFVPDPAAPGPPYSGANPTHVSSVHEQPYCSTCCTNFAMYGDPRTLCADCASKAGH